VRQLLAIRAERWRPQEDKGVHGGLKQRLHGPQKSDALVCEHGCRDLQAKMLCHVSICHRSMRGAMTCEHQLLRCEVQALEGRF